MDPPALDHLNAALEGRYRIERELGEGGMATVYLADDLRHERRVAVKVLKPELAAVVGAERFLAEIKTTANLTHPHILPLHDSGEADGFLFYVMPYVEGESLGDKLHRERQLPVDDAVGIATNLAEALDYAHRQGVIHRDIKPANVLLLDGKPVLSDFGIALAVRAGGGSRLTETGLRLGTPHYMSPEQATGDLNVGPATDVYALGCVLYQMLVGEPPITGSTAQAILGKIVTGRPSAVSEYRKSVPPNVDAAIMTALEKLPADRFATSGEFARALQTASFTTTAVESASAREGRHRWRAGVVSLAVALLALSVWWVTQRPAPDQVFAVPYPMPPGQRLGGTSQGAIALSPDGQQLAYHANGRLYIKRRGQLEGEAIAGIESGVGPFFSPDGRELAFAFRGQLWKIPAAGGAPSALADVGPWFYGGHWADGGFIVFANADGVHRVSEDGGERLTLFETTDPEDAFGPRVLPGGEWVLVTVTTSRGSNRWNEAQIVAYSIDSGERREITHGSDARYVATGHLVYAIDDALYAVDFDRRTLAVSGVPAIVARPVQRAYNPIYWSGTANYDISKDGTFAYVRQLPPGQTSIVTVSRDGVAQPLVDVGDLQVSRLRLSPDGERLLFGATEPNNLWVYDIPNDDLRPLTRDGTDRWPEWVDNTWIAFSSVRSGPDNVFAMRWDRADEPVQLTHESINTHLGIGTRDGRLISMHNHPPGGGSGYAILSLSQQARGEIALDAQLTPPIPGGIAAFSPDGEWVVYRSAPDLYVVRADGSGSRIQLSTGGGQWALWPESGEIFYRRGDQVVAVRVNTEPELRRGDESVLFEGEYAVGGGAGNFEVTPDGQTFFMVVQNVMNPELQRARGHINILLNWTSGLEALVAN